MASNNGDSFNLEKAAEEFSELTTVLLQKLTKRIDGAPDDQEIIDEIGDAIIRLEVLKKMYPEEEIQRRVDFKLEKFVGYIEEKKYSKF